MTFPAFVVTRQDDQLQTAVTELEEAALDDGELLVAVEWSAVNYKDAMVTQPGNRVSRRSLLVPGIDLAGTVTHSTDPAFPVGAAVLAHGYDLGVAHHGGFAGLARVPSGWAVAQPTGLDARQAMVIGTAGFTAVQSLERLEEVGVAPADGPVLVTGATGGVGSMAVAVLAARGFEVVASTGKESEHAYLRGLGAAEVIGRDEVVGDPGRVLGAERWAAAVDCVGGATLAGVLRSVRYGGAVAASGLTGGTDLPSTVYPFIIRHVALLGVDSVLTAIDHRRALWATMAGRVAPGVLDSLVAAEIDLSGIDGAAANLLAARVRGRVLVRPVA
jgi:acrylyl-CoA reductase (NADPH)